MKLDDTDAEAGKTYQPFEFDGQAVAEEIAKILNDVAKHAGSKERFKGSFERPGQVEIEDCRVHNCTAMAKLRISPEDDDAWTPIDIPLLYPHHGVFLLGRGNGMLKRPKQAKLMVWHPHLMLRSGLWLLRIDKDATRTSMELEAQIGLFGGCFLSSSDEAPADDDTTPAQSKTGSLADDTPTNKPAKKREIRGFLPYSLRTPLLNQCAVLELPKIQDEINKHILIGRDSGNIICKELITATRKRSKNKHLASFMSPADLACNRLCTYNVFVTEIIINLICNRWVKDDNKTLNKDYWTNQVNGMEIGNKLRSRIFATGEDMYRWLIPFTPKNTADAISTLTSFSRYESNYTENSGLNKRQNHSSYFRRVCPVQTPESEKIGITLHLAAGAKVDLQGIIYQSTDPSGLGYSASLIPFYHHTDSARAMIGAKNYVQAIPIKGWEKPLVKTGMEDELPKILEPLFSHSIIKNTDEFQNPGRNLVVAYMPFFGLNYNDAIVISKEAAMEFGSFGEDKTEYDYLDPDFNDSEGAKSIRPGNIKMRDIEKPVSRLELGDKLTGRHGNKGVISAILDRMFMPILPFDDRLGPLSGKHVDIILNPLGVISRMNVSQLLESHVGLLKMLNKVDGLPEDTGKPFSKTDAELIRRLLLSINKDGADPVIDRMGRIRVMFRRWHSLAMVEQVPIVIGVQYFVKLNHIPSSKANIRARKPYDALNLNDYHPVTWQAKKGKKVKGGQRIGHMDMWALDAYMAEHLMSQFLTDALRPAHISPESTPKDEQISQTFRAMRDWLFAMCIVLETDDKGRHRLRWANEEEITLGRKEIRCPKKGPREATEQSISASFKCPKQDCCYSVDLQGTAIRMDIGKVYATVGDLFRKVGVILDQHDYDKEIPVHKVTRTTLSVSSGSPTVSILRKVCSSAIITITTPAGVTDYCALNRESNAKTLIDILGMELCCNKKGHTSERLEADADIRKMRSVCAYGGLADPNIFTDHIFSWGYIRLPESVSATFPKYLKKYMNLDKTPSFSVIPVIPWMYRSGAATDDGFRPLSDQLTEVYENILTAILSESPFKLTGRISNLFFHLDKCISEKNGLLCKDGCGRQVDDSGRLVCIPEPKLEWDECGFSAETLRALLAHDKTVQSMDTTNTDFALQQYLKTTKYRIVIGRSPTLHKYNLKVLRPTVLSRIRSGSNVIAVNPLVCQSMGLDWDGDEIGFYLVNDTPECLSDAEQLMPTNSQNLLSVATGNPVAEFDQDFVLGTYLISKNPILRARFFKDVHFSNRFPKKEPGARVPPWDAKWCHKMQKNFIEFHKDTAVKRITNWMRLAFEAVSISGVTFSYFDLLECKTATSIGEITSPDDTTNSWLDGEAMKSMENILSNYKSAAPSFLIVGADDKYILELQGDGQMIVHQKLASPGFHIAAMVKSKARGDKQIRQLIAARGHLVPGFTYFDDRGKNFFFSENLTDGMSDPERSFYAAMNGRSTMSAKKLDTAFAGSLTHKLVYACWSWRIEGSDCGSDESVRSPATCQFGSKKRICRKCYGTLPDGNEVSDGYPAGLVAAQSIGERGTQLAMKSFQTGSKTMNIKHIMKKLEKANSHVDFDTNDKGVNDFINIFDGNTSAYKEIIPKHKQLLWRVIYEASVAGDRNLLSAIKRECNDDLFVALTSPYTQWLSIANALERGGGGAWQNPGLSSIERIIIGNPGLKPLSLPAKDDSETNTYEEAPNDEKADDDQALEDDGGGAGDSDASTSKNAKIAPRKENNGLPTRNKIIGIIVSKRDGLIRCRIELSQASDLDGKRAILARLFADLLQKSWKDFENSVSADNKAEAAPTKGSDLLSSFKQQISIMTSLKVAKSDLSTFERYTVIYWKNYFLPVRALRGEKGNYRWCTGCLHEDCSP